MKNTKLGTIFIGSIFVLSGVGVSYAAWFDTLNIYGIVNTGSVSWEVVDYYGTWIYKNLETEECIESENPINNQDMLLVAYAEAISGDMDFDVKVIFDNLFPCIWFKAGISIRYTGSIPGKISSINYIYNSESNWIDALVSNNDFYIHIKDSSDNIVDLGYQLHKNDEIFIEFCLHIPQQQELMNLSGSFTATFEIMQWNEFEGSDDENNVEPFDISNYIIYQTSSDLSYTIQEGIAVNPGGYVIIARDSNKEDFESFWGIILPTNVVFINGDNNFPSINGDETFELQDSNSIVVDGPTGQPMISYNTPHVQKKLGADLIENLLQDNIDVSL